MRFKNPVPELSQGIATLRNMELQDIPRLRPKTGKIILKGGRVIDPVRSIDRTMDLTIQNGVITALEGNAQPHSGDGMMDVAGLYVVPGFLDLHLHIYDLLTFHLPIIEEAVIHGVTTALTPGASNSLRAPSFLGSEVDRGSLLNIGCYLGALNLLGLDASPSEIARFLRGEMEEEVALQKISRSRITLRTAPLAVGIKDHQAHFILSEEKMKSVIEISAESQMLFMTHTQCPSYAEEIVRCAGSYPVHLGHTDAAATFGDEGYRRVLDLIRSNGNVTGELTASLLRPSRGDRDAIRISEDSQRLSFEALREGIINILISDGPAHSSKGFGDTKDFVPALLELIEKGILNPVQAFATVTTNPARLLTGVTGQSWWVEELGSLKEGTRADIAVIDPREREVVATFVKGEMVAFAGRIIRKGYGAGGWVTRCGILDETGIGDLARLRYSP